MPKKVTIEGSNLLEKISDDWGGKNNSGSTDVIHGTPVPARAEWGVNRGEIERFIKQQFGSKAGEFYHDEDTEMVLVFADKESRELYLSNRETYEDLLLGSFVAPSNYTVDIKMTTPANNTVLSGSKGNYIVFEFDIINRSGSSTGESVIATFTFNNAGNVKKVTQLYDAGTHVQFLADDYLSDGRNSVSVVITGRNTSASTMAAIAYDVVNLKLTSEYPFSQPAEKGSLLAVPYTLEGANNKYVEWYIDGVKHSETQHIEALHHEGEVVVDTTDLTVGKHSIQIRAFISVGSVNYYSNTLYYDFVVTPVDSVWADPAAFILFGLILPEPELSALSVSALLYREYAYQLATYDSGNHTLELLISDNGTQIQSLQTENGKIENLNYAATTIGAHTLSFSAGGATASLTVNVESGDIDIRETTDSLLLKLSAKGRSNDESHPDTWTFTQETSQGGNTIEATFSGFDWNEQSGWHDDYLVMKAGDSVDINLAVLGGNPTNRGRTIEIEYETTNIEDENAAIISLVNPSTNAGLTLTASTAKLQSSGGANVNTKYRDGDKRHLTFIINRTTGTYGCLMFIVNNGILERAASFAATDSFFVDSNLHIESSDCTIKLRSISVYNCALTVDEAFCNYAVNADNLIEIANSNDILNASKDEIDADKVNAKIPIIIITGDMQSIFNATDKNVTVYVDVEYRNLQDPEKSFMAKHLRMRPQGTSSLGYPRKNLRLYTSSEFGCVMTDANGEVLEDGLYAFKDNAQPVNCWTLKADYAESSGSHNTGVARLWNDLMYNAQFSMEVNGQSVTDFWLRTEAQKQAIVSGYDYDVRTTVDGFPIVVFHHQTAKEKLVCLGQYNFNNDKSTEKVFGFTDIPGFNNSKVQCFEFLDNENPICLFDNVSNFDNGWSAAFESRYPDTKTPNLDPLKTLAEWINSCKNNQSKWNNEKATHFDLPKLAAYYVYLMRFGAIDQPVKNAMIETEDGQHWFFINYDNDTILGIDNISAVLNAWDYDRSSQKTGGAYYYAGHNSVLWNCFEADPDCMALVRTVDQALGLTYAKLINMFDNEQCHKWCERIYNDNGIYKYIQPFKEKGSAVLYMLQGSRESYRHWWLQHRMDMFDNMWGNGEFKNRIISFKADGAEAGGTFDITAANDSNFGYGINSVEMVIGVSIGKDASHTFTVDRALAMGSPVAIYNANNISEVDLSDFVGKLYTLSLDRAVGYGGVSKLKKLTLSDGETDNEVLQDGIGGLDVITSLEELDIRNFKTITSLGLTTLRNLHVLKAAGSGLTSFIPAVGAKLADVSLPSSITSIVLDSAEVTSLTYTPTTALTTVQLKNVTGLWSAKTFVNTWLASLSDAQLQDATLTLKGIIWTGMTAAQVIKIGKAAKGVENLSGKVTLSSITYSEYEDILEVFGNNVFRYGSSFIIDAPSGNFITGPTDLIEGDRNEVSTAFFPISSSNIQYLLYNEDGNTTGVTEETDAQGNVVYREYGGVTLYAATGQIIVDDSIESDVTVKVKAQQGGATTDFFSINAKKITYPSTLSISGNDTMISKKDYTYNEVFTGDFTARILNVEWSLSSYSYVDIKSSDFYSAKLNLKRYADSQTDVTLTCRVTLSGNEIFEATKNITIKVVPQEAVDMGLPSGTLWAKGYLTKSGNSYVIGEPQVDGSYFSWGNIVGREHSWIEPYDYSAANYATEGDTDAEHRDGGHSVDADIASNDARHDAAVAWLDNGWHLPTEDNFRELFDECTWTFTNINNVYGFQVTGSNGNTLFFVASGYREANNTLGRYSNMYCWTNTRVDDEKAKWAQCTQNLTKVIGNTYRYYGLTIRPVL